MIAPTQVRMINEHLDHSIRSRRELNGILSRIGALGVQETRHD
jgi:hypothetical protein